MKQWNAVLIGSILLLPTSLSSQSVQRVDVGGHELEAVILGTGSPTVVFESDIGTSLGTWTAVQALVSEFATTLHIPGPGWVTPMWRPRLDPLARSSRRCAHYFAGSDTSHPTCSLVIRSEVY